MAQKRSKNVLQAQFVPPVVSPAQHGPRVLRSEESAAIQHDLIEWFGHHGRDLPWRQTRTPFHVLVAEMMLQQTQVARVIDRYAAFLTTFPTLEALAAAPTAMVIQAWAGLGYNRRAVYLQQIAQRILTEHEGVFPQDVATLQQLPGIGPYTAGAIACFAFEQDVAFMDTNIRRVLHRFLVGPITLPPSPSPTRNATSPSSTISDKQLLENAQTLIPPGQGWEWNQALMEVGAVICAASPQCSQCPLRVHGCAYAVWCEQRCDILPDAGDGPFSVSSSELPSSSSSSSSSPAPKSQPFIGSNRYYRGRVIATLRTLRDDATLPLDKLGPQVKEAYGPDDRTWLKRLIAGLERDGLVECEGDQVRLPHTTG